LSLGEIPSGARVFLEASIFLNHFLGASRECRALLERCERSEVRGLTSALALAAVAERLMTLEAEAADEPIPERTPRSRAETAAKSHLHEEAVARIPLMGVEVRPLDLRAVLLGGSLRLQQPLPTRVSLDVAVAREAGASALATAEPGREGLDGLRVSRASDLP